MSNSDGISTPVFVSYSHWDKKRLERLQVQLKPLVRTGDIDLWDDTRIQPGAARRGVEGRDRSRFGRGTGRRTADQCGLPGLELHP